MADSDLGTLQKSSSFVWTPGNNILQCSSVLQRSLESKATSKAAVQPNDKGKQKNNALHWWHIILLFSGASLLICLFQIILPPPFGFRMTSTEVADIGVSPEGCSDGLERCICPRETICATDRVSMILLALARASAFFDYPLYMMMFLSKAHNLNNMFRRTILRECIDFADMHHIHSIFGIVIGVETMSHSILHIIRWTINSDIDLLWKTGTGVTGFIAASITPLIVWPMAIPALKANLKYEIRKGLHYLSWVWAIVLMWHAPSQIYYLIGIPALIYLLDYVYGLFVRNHLIENVYFERYGEKGVTLHFENPLGYDGSKTSYVYIMCPWISKSQWHAFTMFPEPNKDNFTMLCIGTSGDWTQEMYNKIKAPCLKPVYVNGPFTSEFSDKAVNTTNALAIASGIGITPTISLMLSYAGKKRINIIWMCRDPGLIEYFLHKVDINAVTKNSFALIYYTGKRELVLPNHLPINFFIFHSRPKLEETISGIVTAIHSGQGLPEEMYESQKTFANIPFEKRIKVALSRVANIYSKKEMFDYAVSETSSADFANFEALRDKQFDSYLGTLNEDLSEREFLVEAGSNLPQEVPQDNVVSVDGLESMICSFFGGIGEYRREDIESLFRQVDTDESGYIDKVEFVQFMDLATGEEHFDEETAEIVSMALDRGLRESLHGMRNSETMIGDEHTVKYMEKLISDRELPLNDWSLFYCGASTPVEKTLRGIEKKYGMTLGIEKFNW